MKKSLVNSNRNVMAQLMWDFEYKDLLNRFETAPSRELDSHFYKELKPLVKSLSRLDSAKRKILVNVISSLMEVYITNKVDRELDHLFRDLIKL